VRRQRNNPVLEKVTIESIAAEGKALGRVDGKVVFVPFAIPGDVVDIQVTRKRSSYMEGFVIRFHEYSTNRIKPFCGHFETCGGCKWQMLPYNEQLRFKQEQVADQFQRIGRVDLPIVEPIVGSEKTRYYRNKLEFTFSSSRWLSRDEIDSGIDFNNQATLGFHVPGRFDKVFKVNECFLQPDPSNAIRLETERFGLENGYSFYNLRTGEGFLRNIIIRNSSLGDVMVILSVTKNETEQIHSILGYLKNTFPSITSLMYVVNSKANDTISDLDVILFEGNDFIMEEMEGIKFKVGPKSFYQTNSEQAYTLYSIARSFANLTGRELVYDLYTGTGTIANFIAKNSRRVVGVEYVPEAIADARENSRINGIENTTFFAGDMKDLLVADFFQANGYPDVVILDPPRAGIHPDVAAALLAAHPLRIVYVSCNPATQARDVNLLSSKYKLTRIQPVDMFPHTHHVENVALLERI
jgi:23S rRNA (uracil1939-C5)-methyltransferase